MGGGASMKQLQETNEQLEASKAEAKELQASKEATDKKLQEAEAREAEASEKAKGLESSLAEKERELQEVKDQLKHSQSQVKTLEAQVKTLKAQLPCDEEDDFELPCDAGEDGWSPQSIDAPDSQRDPAVAAATPPAPLPPPASTLDASASGDEAIAAGAGGGGGEGLPGSVTIAGASAAVPSSEQGAVPSWKQSVSLADVVKFFKDGVGDLWWEAPRAQDLLPRPRCTTSKLAQICARWNSTHRMQIAARRTAPHTPDFLGLLKLVLTPMLRRQRRAKMTVAELWGCSPQSEQASVYVCHSWHENFGCTLEALLTFFLRSAALNEPGLDFDTLEAAALQVRFYSAGFCEVPTGHRSQQGGAGSSQIRSALQQASISSAVIVVDDSAAVFCESWCQLEMFEAWKAEKKMAFLADQLESRSSGLHSPASSSGKPPQELVKFMLDAALEADLGSGGVSSMAEVEEVKAYVEQLGGPGMANAVFKAAMSTWLLPLLAQVQLADDLRTAVSAGARAASTDFRGISAVALASAAHGEGSEQVAALLASGGDKASSSLAHDVLEMFDDDSDTRDKAIQKIRATGKGPGGVARHSEALLVAEREHADRVIRSGLCELKSGEPEKRRSALKKMAALGTLAKAQHRLMSQLVKDDDPAVREAAAEVVVATGESFDLLEEPDPKVRKIALKSLTTRGPATQQEADRQGPILVRLLGDPDWIVRHSALHALGQLGMAASPYAGPVAQCLNDQQWYIRHAALLVLGKIPDAAKVHSRGVAACLGDGEKEVRKAAAETLEKLGVSN